MHRSPSLLHGYYVGMVFRGFLFYFVFQTPFSQGYIELHCLGVMSPQVGWWLEAEGVGSFCWLLLIHHVNTQAERWFLSVFWYQLLCLYQSCWDREGLEKKAQMQGLSSD